MAEEAKPAALIDGTKTEAERRERRSRRSDVVVVELTVVVAVVLVAAWTRGRGEMGTRASEVTTSGGFRLSMFENATVIEKTSSAKLLWQSRRRRQLISSLPRLSYFFSERESSREAGRSPVFCAPRVQQLSPPDARHELSLSRCSGSNSSSGPVQRSSSCCKQRQQQCCHCRQRSFGQRRSDGRRRRGARRVAGGADTRERAGAARPKQVRLEEMCVRERDAADDDEESTCLCEDAAASTLTTAAKKKNFTLPPKTNKQGPPPRDRPQPRGAHPRGPHAQLRADPGG